MKKALSKLTGKSNDNSSSNTQSSGPYRQPASSSTQDYAPPLGPPPMQQSQQPYQIPNNQYQTYAQPPGPPPQQQSYQAPAQARPAGREDPFAALRRYDTVFVVDDSESMEMFWDETRESLVGVVEKAVQYDEDGIDIYFFNSTVVVQNLRTAQEVRSLFRRVDPRRSTPTARALKRVVEPYLASLEANHRAKETGGQTRQIKPMSIIVLTDGAPDRNEEPEGVIVNAGKRLEAIRAPASQLGFSFVQIGQDEEAEQALTYLDDHLKTEYGIRDMVDTTLFPADGVINSEYLLKALLGGMNRSIDKK